VQYEHIDLNLLNKKLRYREEHSASIVFRAKLHFTWRKSATKFLCVNTVSNKVVRNSLAYLSVQKLFAGDVRYTTWKFGRNWPTPSKTPISNQYSLVAPQPLHLAKKSSIDTHRKLTTSFPITLRWTVYVAPKPPSPKGEHKNTVSRV